MMVLIRKTKTETALQETLIRKVCKKTSWNVRFSNIRGSRQFKNQNIAYIVDVGSKMEKKGNKSTSESLCTTYTLWYIPYSCDACVYRRTVYILYIYHNIGIDIGTYVCVVQTTIRGTYTTIRFGVFWT